MTRRAPATPAIVAALIGALLVACQKLPQLAVSPKVSSLQSQPVAAQLAALTGGQAGTQANPPGIHGHVDFSMFKTQAISGQQPGIGTLTLIDLSTGGTVATGYTDSYGNFSLPVTSFVPQSGTMFMLESTHDLNSGGGSQGAGSGAARFRTFIEWTGSAWQSIADDAGNVYLNADTTALAVVSSLDPRNISPLSTLGEVADCSATCVMSTPNPAAYSRNYLINLATAIEDYLASSYDPVLTTSATSSTIAELYPSNPTMGGAMLITGSGFSPRVGDNSVYFGNTSYPATVFMASANKLGVWVPAGAPSSGNVYVSNSLLPGITSNGMPYNLGGLEIASVTPDRGQGGDTLMIRGSGFSTIGTSVTFAAPGGGRTSAAPLQVLDSQTLLVTVPTGSGVVTSGAIEVTVNGGTAGYNFDYLGSAAVSSFTPTTGSGLVSIDGTGFGAFGSQSRVAFNGVPSPNIVEWNNGTLQAYAPQPSLTSKVSGDVTVSGTGFAAQSTSPFIAQQTVNENFMTAAHVAPGTTAAWGGGVLQPTALTTIWSEGWGMIHPWTANATYSGLEVTSAYLQLGDSGSFQHTGVVTNDFYRNQLGVTPSGYLYVTEANTTNVNDAPNIYQYYSGITDAYGSQTDELSGNPSSVSRPDVENEIYDPANGVYVTSDCESSGVDTLRVITCCGWDGNTYNINTSNVDGASGNFPSEFLATNGLYYFTSAAFNTPTGYLFWSAESPWAFEYEYDSSNLINENGAAGFIGDPTFFYQNNSAGSISNLLNLTYVPPNTVTLNASVNLPAPFSSSSPISAARVPQIGSDGTYLYILGSNANYNNYANTVFKFGPVSGTSLGNFLGYSTTTPGVTDTQPITLPAGSNWDQVQYEAYVPPNTSLTISVYDSVTKALLAQSSCVSGLGYLTLNAPTSDPIYLEAFFATSDTAYSPRLYSWEVNSVGTSAVSSAYDTGTNFPVFQSPTVASNDVGITIDYSDSADGVNWSTWTSDPTTLSRRYIRFKIGFPLSTDTVSDVRIPYDY